ncbi:hypothetical protein B6U96_10925 [Archaeoglobales archaeon ex4484_92]|nr:MAG: hypothetical protein B6U96_10925 [Archaeoglobales archaeon ex4484_92]
MMKAVLPEIKCEICGKKAKGVCPRCYRFVCENCIDPTTLECIDCASVKRILEKDLIRYVENISNKIKFMESNFSACYTCPIYKDAIMSYLRRVKELRKIAELESYEDLHDKINEVKETVQNLAIKYLIKIKMSK